MFPDWSQARKRLVSRLDELSSQRTFQLIIASFLACMHLAMFARCHGAGLASDGLVASVQAREPKLKLGP